MANIQGFGIQLATGGFSLEANTIFATYAEALAYAKSSAAYVGKLISITSGEHKGAYSIEAVGADAAFKKLGSDIDLSNYVTKDQITNLYTYKGSKATFAELPVVNEVGDVWNVEEAYDGHAAGTNWSWNGTEWDALAGSIDLSGYALKATVDKALEDANAAIAVNTGAISNLQSAVSTKVEKVEGQSLIPAEKLTLIDTNAGAISALSKADESLASRIKTLEEAFVGEGGTIDLSEVSTKLGDHATRIEALESDNSNNKTEIGNLKTTTSGLDTRLQAVESINTQQTGQISGLTTELGNVKASVTANATNITNLGTTVGEHTTSIGEIKQTLNNLGVKSVAADEKVISADTNGALKTTLALDSYLKDGKTFIKLTGIEGAIISEFDASSFVKDGMIDTVSYDPDTKEMTITWNTEAGKQPVVIPMSGLVDTYTAGNGLALTDGEFAVKVNEDTNNKLTITENGLMVDITNDVNAINTSVDSKIAQAFTWIEV